MVEMDDKMYAQILKSNNRVNLIGDKELGLYLFDLPLAYTVDLSEHMQKDTVQVGMVHDKESNTFIDYVPPDPQPEPVPDPDPPELTEIEQATLTTAVGVDYLICMSEI